MHGNLSNYLANLQTLNVAKVANFLTNLGRNFHIHDAIDILIVAFFIYVILLFVKQTRSYFIFTTVILMLIVSYSATYFDLALTRKLFNPILTFFLVIFVIVFQREIRRFFRWLATRRRSYLVRKANASIELCDTLVESALELAKRKSGAIIVLPGDFSLDEFIEGGFSLDGKITTPLILSIFDHTSPGHDGAVIIENNRIRRFGVHLPLAAAEGYQGFNKTGTRHRAAAGVTEPSDALAIVVSEERGVISIAEEGKLRQVDSKEELCRIIKNFLKANDDGKTETVAHYLLINNFKTKLLSLALSSLLWFFLVYNTNIVNRQLTVPIEFQHVPTTLQVDRVAPQSVEVTLSGDNADISDLQVSDVHVVADLETATSGIEEVSINESNVSYPSYLTLIKASPSRFSVTLVPIEKFAQ